MRRPSSLDVARAAGVSQSAVSRAFTPGAVIAPATRARVHAAAEALGYTPNDLARALLTNRSNVVALVVGDIDDPFYATLVNGFSWRLQAAGLQALLFAVGEGRADVATAVDRLLRLRVDGAILIAAELSAEMAAGLAAAGTPAVLFNRAPGAASVSAVRLDNHAGGLAVAAHLLARGRRRVGVIAGTNVDATSADRERGLRDGLAAAGIAPVARAEGGYTFEGGAAAMRALWAGMRADAGPAQRFDALFCASDLMAFGALDAARHELGIAVPRDLAVVGFDDLRAAAWPSYALTTVRQPVEAMIAAAADTLLAKIADKATVPRTVLLRGELIARGSTA